MRFMDSVGERIYRLRKDLGMTQDELAQKLGYKSKTSINKIEMGKSEFPQKKLADFANALDTTPGYLLGLVSEKAAKLNQELACYTHMMVKDADGIPELGTIDRETIMYAIQFSKLSPTQRAAVRQLTDVFLASGENSQKTST